MGEVLSNLKQRSLNAGSEARSNDLSSESVSAIPSQPFPRVSQSSPNPGWILLSALCPFPVSDNHDMVRALSDFKDGHL